MWAARTRNASEGKGCQSSHLHPESSVLPVIAVTDALLIILGLV